MVNKNYLRGRRNEYKAIKILTTAGYYCIRSAGSHGFWDIIALSKTGIRLIQCKTNGHYNAIDIEKIQEFKDYPPGCSKELWVFYDRKSIPTIEVF
jgi:Holliday junction resolvase